MNDDDPPLTEPPPPVEEQQLAPSEPYVAPTAPLLRIYSHSSIFYRWPVWVVGYVMALLTCIEGQSYQLGQSQTWAQPSSSLGLIFFTDTNHSPNIKVANQKYAPRFR